MQQIDPGYHFSINQRGAVSNQNYFKDICQKIYTGQCTPDAVDYSKTFWVDNSHFFMPWLLERVPAVYFIDYPDTANRLIVEMFMRKRITHPSQSMQSTVRPFVPAALQSQVTPDNAQQIAESLWLKQIRQWRATKGLQRLDMADLFDIARLSRLVELLLGVPITNRALLQQTQQRWLDMNPEMKDFFIN